MPLCLQGTVKIVARIRTRSFILRTVNRTVGTGKSGVVQPSLCPLLLEAAIQPSMRGVFISQLLPGTTRKPSVA
jgi:hypothetical protein